MSVMRKGLAGRSGVSARKRSAIRGIGLSAVQELLAGYIRRSTMSFLISAIAFAGLRPFGQVCAQFMIVWQR